MPGFMHCLYEHDVIHYDIIVPHHNRRRQRVQYAIARHFPHTKTGMPCYTPTSGTMVASHCLRHTINRTAALCRPKHAALHPIAGCNPNATLQRPSLPNVQTGHKRQVQLHRTDSSNLCCGSPVSNGKRFLLLTGTPLELLAQPRPQINPDTGGRQPCMARTVISAMVPPPPI